MSAGKILGKTYVINGSSADVSGFKPDMSVDTYYEVIRLIDGKILFLPDHLGRLQISLAGSGIDFPGEDTLVSHLGLLLKQNSFTFGNIRICLQPSKENGADLLCYFIPYSYPSASMYQEGVRLLSYPYTRPQPGIKKWDDHFRSSVGRYIQDHDIYEAVLINRSKQVTEGSRSNLFFIDRHDCLITAPTTEVLPGITRKYVLEIAGQAGISVREKSMELGSLGDLASAFLSGTSPKVLPVNQVDQFHFNPGHPLLQLFMTRFEQLVQEHLVAL
jgi:branched-chain amino acid aminotransferase